MRRPALLRLLSGAALVAAGAMTNAGDARANPTAGGARTAAVIRESTWDAGGRDSWSAFTVRVSSEHGFSGEVRLAPTPLRQATGTSTGTGTGTGTEKPEPDRPAPTLRAPLALEPGVERLVSVMVPVGEAAYRAELWDGSGAMVFAGQARRAQTGATFNVGVLTDLGNGDALLQAASQLPLNISRRFRSAGDFPASVLSFAGLDAVVVGDLDSTALSVEQRQALQDFVGLGGALVLTGGVEGPRTAAALPDVLVPLRPDGTAVASLAPLADLAKQTTNRVTTITTGALQSGRVAVGAVTGPPLVVEARYGWGRIVQLTYDPFALAAEPQAADAAFRPVPWSVGLLRAGPALAAASAASPAQPAETASPPAPAWSVLEGQPGPRPAKGGPAGLLLVAYPVVAGALVLALGRSRNRGARPWIAVPALAALVTAAVLPVGWGLGRGGLTVDELSIERLGPAGGAGELASFHRMVPSGRADLVLRLPNPSLASIAAAPRPPRAFPAVLPERGLPLGPGSDLVDLGHGPRVDLRHLGGWDARRLHTLTPAGAGPGLEAHLRLQAGRLVGTVTNRGDRPVRRLRAQRGEAGRAQLASELGPGATATVDVPFAPVAPATHPQIASVVLDTAAATVSGDLPPGALVLVGLVAAPPALPAQRSLRMNTTHRAVLAPAQVEGADDFALDFGTPRAVCCGSYGTGVYDLQVPTGMTGPFAVEQQGGVGAAIYDWTTGGWRGLPPGRQTQQTAVLPTEIRDGVVQVRTESTGQPNPIRVVALSTASP